MAQCFQLFKAQCDGMCYSVNSSSMDKGCYCIDCVMSLHVCTSYMFLLFVLFVSTVVVNGEYATIRYSIYVRSKADAMASLI